MRVYIVRHGKAENDAPSGLDVDRLLAPRGGEQARFLGEQIAQTDDRPSLIISSPVIRAFTTAQLIHAILRGRLDTSDALRVDEPVSGALDLLTALAFPATGSPPDCIMLVGHNPQVSELCEVLANGVGSARCSFRTGEAVLLQVDRGNLIGSAKLIRQLRLDKECTTSCG